MSPSAFEKAWRLYESESRYGSLYRECALHFWNAALDAAKAAMPEKETLLTQYDFGMGWNRCLDATAKRIVLARGALRIQRSAEPGSGPGETVTLEAANAHHQNLVHPAGDGEKKCSECGSAICERTDCHECCGEDDTGDQFCPACDYCCGC